MNRPGRATGWALALIACAACGRAAPPGCGDTPSGSPFAVRFVEGDSVPAAGRILIPLLDDKGETTSADIGDGSFTIELWVKGEISDQIRPRRGYRAPGRAVASFDWITSNILIDRSVYSRKYPVFGAGFHRDGDPSASREEYDRAVLRFGVRSGTQAGVDDRYTIQGRRHVLDGSWHHVALIRDVAARSLAIVVDGELDVATRGDRRPTAADLSYPVGAERDDNVTNPRRSPYIVIGTEKHDLGSDSPGFSGSVDEIRLWNRARTPAEIAADYRLSEPLERDGLAAHYRLDEGGGVRLEDAAGGVTAQLRRGGLFGRRDAWTDEGAPVHCPDTEVEITQGGSL